MEEQKLMQLIVEMIQAKVTPQEMIGKLTQMGLSEDQAISAVKMVASKLNGDQEQPEKMQNGDAIQPVAGQAIEPKYQYEFTQDSMNHPDAGTKYRYLMDDAVRAGYGDAKQDVDGNWTALNLASRKRVPVQVSGNRASVLQGRQYKEQPWLSTIVANSKKPAINMQAPAPAPQLLAGSAQPARPVMENGGNLQFYKKGGKMAPVKPGKKEKKCSCGCKLVLKKVGGKITEQCGCGCKVKK